MYSGTMKQDTIDYDRMDAVEVARWLKDRSCSLEQWCEYFELAGVDKKRSRVLGNTQYYYSLKSEYR